MYSYKGEVNVELFKAAMVMMLFFGSNSLEASASKTVNNKKAEVVEEKIELQPMTAPNVPAKFMRGCRCEIGDIVLQTGVMGSDEVLIQRSGKYEELSGLDDLDSKKINADKSIVTFSAANKKINVSFRCEKSYVNSEYCNEGGCGEVLYKCDVEAKSKDGKRKKRYEYLEGNCVC